MPQPLTYLITDSSRRYGRLRVGTANAYLRAEVPRQGLRTPFRGGTVQDLAKEMLTQ